MIVAIDGPAGSGKSTTARRVAERMGWLYLDTGAMYRAVALAFLRRDLPFTAEAAATVLSNLDLDLRKQDGGLRVGLDGEDVTEAIRTPAVSDAASRVSALPAVRERLVEEQRRIGYEREEGGVVLEGRDTGTVVFPDADLKVFLVADPAERARRRHRELQQRGAAPPLDAVRADLDARDARDTGRQHAPLAKAPDAVELDTTALTLDEQVERVVRLVRERQAASAV